MFCSRSSVNFIELSEFALYILPVLQCLNVVIFYFNAIYNFIPHIGIVFTFILFEGFFGGASYVNTFNHIHKKVKDFQRFLWINCAKFQVAPEVREFSLSVASLADSVGIVFSGILSIPMHNHICSQI